MATVPISWLYVLHASADAPVLYVGRSVNPIKRLEEHRDGRVRTTRKCAQREGIATADLHMTVLGAFADDNFPTAEGDAIAHFQSRGEAKWNFPYAFTAEDCKKARQKGLPLAHETNRRQGYPGLVKGRASQAAAGYPNLVKGRQSQKVAGYPNFARARERFAELGHPNIAAAHEAQRRDGYACLRPAAAKGRETQRRMGHPNLHTANAVAARQRTMEEMRLQGFPNLARANHVRWHISRGRYSDICALCCKGDT